MVIAAFVVVKAALLMPVSTVSSGSATCGLGRNEGYR
jgi:hypothetical protein